jgi:WD40 repeat protein
MTICLLLLLKTVHRIYVVLLKGNVQVWDIRQPSLYLKKYAAHNGLALTVAWNGDWIASGGRDKTIKICTIY